MKKFLANITVATLGFLPIVAFAQVVPPPKAIENLKTTTGTDAAGLGYSASSNADIKTVVIDIVNWVLGFLGIAAVILVIYGGILWMTSGGEDKRAKQGKMVLKNAVIGLAIILAAYVFVNFIITTVMGITKNA